MPCFRVEVRADRDLSACSSERKPHSRARTQSNYKRDQQEPRSFHEWTQSVLITEPVANLHVNLPRVVPVKAAKGLAVVQFHATVRYVQGI